MVFIYDTYKAVTLSVGPTLRPCQIEQCKYLKEHQDANAPVKAKHPLRLLS